MVIGHAVGLLRSTSDLAVVVSNFVYMFHIPVLVLLAGWGARRTKADGTTLAKIFWQLLLPFVVFQLIAFLFNFLFEDDSPSWSFTSQTFGLWFLVALAAWRLLAPWFRGLKFAIPITILLALLAGLSPDIGGYLSLSRILVFLPIFLAGPWVIDKISMWRHDLRYKLVGAVVLLAGGVVTLLTRRDFWRTPFLGNAGYEALDVDPVEGMMWRLLVLTIGTAMAAAFMLVLPGKPGAPSPIGGWVAKAGRKTMYPYLLHLPILTLVGATAVSETFAPSFQTALFVIAAFVFCTVTVAKSITKLAAPLIEPRRALVRW
ncbi:hypothetical protein HGO92_16515 [Arthrobacter sp. SF27]|nr:hypothetical protein [Arthrobacter sp. SF27]